MINAKMKISEILAEYPQTLEVLVKISPHFKKLENKFLKKALTSRITIEQASIIAGVDLNFLLAELNKSINKSYVSVNNGNKEVQTESIKKEIPEFLKEIEPNKFHELDVRPIIEAGKDPFNIIMNEIKKIKNDGVLLIINSFEPVPLYSVLGKKGFDHYTENEHGVYKVYFYRKKDLSESETFQKDKSQLKDIEYKNIIELDVRGLEPPEPMMKILEKLSQVNEETVLIVHHHREPMMLYPKLEERGYEAISNKIEENYYKVVITKKIKNE